MAEWFPSESQAISAGFSYTPIAGGGGVGEKGGAPSVVAAAPVTAPAAPAAGQITIPTTEEETRAMDDIINWVLTQKQTYGTKAFPFDNREDMIEQGKLLWPKYAQFIVDTIYRELRGPTEPAYQPPPYEVYQPPVSPTGNTALDDLLTSLSDYLKELQKRGQTIDPYVEITPEKMAEFLAQAETEISPYYSTQLKLAREDFLRTAGYTKDEILRQEGEYQRTYGTGLRTLGETMAEKGFAVSGPRLVAERELAEETQRDIEKARREAEFKLGTTARTFAKTWGYGETAVPTIPEAPRVLAGVPEFEKAARELPLYEISPETYAGLIGEKEWEAKAEKKTRAAELEKAFKETELAKRYRTLAV